MIRILLNKDDLKKVIGIACLATEASENSITGHCLFEMAGKVLRVLSTDKRNMMAQSTLELPVEIDESFTVDSRKMGKLLRTADSDTIALQYDKTKETVQVFLSGNEDSFISLPSFSANQYAPVKEVFAKAYDLKTVNAGVLLEGIRFIKGFLEPKDKIFSNLFISGGVFYGSNGSTMAAAFTCPDLVGLDELILPASVLSPIISMINDLDLQNILIQTTSNAIMFSSPDKKHVYGFTKVKIKIPHIPVSIKESETDGWAVDKSVLLKKLGCFRITGRPELGIKGTFQGEKLSLSTISERSSQDFMPCKKIKEPADTSFVAECRLLEDSFRQFGGNELNFFILAKKLIIYHKADLEITEKENKILKSFTSIAAVVRSKEET